MPAAVYNFVIEQGSEFEISFQYNDINGVGVDLSGKCILCRLLQDNGGQRAFTSLSNSSLDIANGGYTLTGNNEGLIVFNLASQLTKDFTFTSASYDLDIIETIDGVSKNTRLSTGIITIQSRIFSEVIQDCTVFGVNSLVSSGSGSPTPTPTVTITSTPEPSDLCLPDDCLELDIYSVVYTGSGISISDNSRNSGTVTVSNTGLISNVELAINGLKHSSPQDLTMLLAPPSGNKILLSSHNKISNYASGFSFMFSNKAVSGAYINTAANGGLINILDKTSIVRYDGETLNSGFSHLFNYSVTGNWTLYMNDDDPGTSGSIDSWKLIVTYVPTE